MTKTIKNCFTNALTFDKMYDAYLRTIDGKRNKRDALLFEVDVETNIISLIDSIRNHTYKLSKYHVFKIYEPKERIIKSLPFKDRVVHQWYVHEFIKPYILPRLIKDTYACIDNRGTHKAVKQTQLYMNKMSREYKDYYVIKGDIKKYFDNINKDILFKIMLTHIKDKYLIDLTKLFIYDNNLVRSIPIGNYTSQFYANIYLSKLDYYVKHELKCKYYLRFMDDFIILVKNKEESKLLLSSISNFLNKELELELNYKTRYFPNKFGINFCGYIIHNDFILLRDRTIKKIKDDIRNKKFIYKNYYGHLKHANCYNFINKKI